ncbi:hypothetical protein ES702_03036 [subsurface metagenome]
MELPPDSRYSFPNSRGGLQHKDDPQLRTRFCVRLILQTRATLSVRAQPGKSIPLAVDLFIHMPMSPNSLIEYHACE